jgi:hypothetical protein
LKLVRDARTLKMKAISSLRTGMSSFNSYEDDGRVTSVLLHLQHACEMLLKAVLAQKKIGVFDNKTGKSIGFDRCLNMAQAKCGISVDEAGIMRSVDSLRDAEQHWIVVIAEDMLYLHTKAVVTSFDAIMKRTLGDDLTSHIPPRVLPVSTKPPGDFEFLVDREYKLITNLLQPGKRQRDEARGRIRSLIAMEALVSEEIGVSEKDIDRIEKAIKAGQGSAQVFPRLSTIATSTSGEGVNFKVHFTKKEGAPVRFVSGDEPEAAAAVREVDLQRKFHLRASELAAALKLTGPKSCALRDHLGIDNDQNCCHVFKFGSTKIPCYSDNAMRRMTKALETLDIKEIWQVNKLKKRS